LQLGSSPNQRKSLFSSIIPRLPPDSIIIANRQFPVQIRQKLGKN
jgi:hypothetical protein